MFRSVRSVAFSAFSSGGLLAVAVRPSSGSPSRFVAVVSFRSPAAACRFAARFAPRVGLPLRVRGSAVSVPVPVEPRAPGLGRCVPAAGGVRGLDRSLSALGWL